jgi:hypothetical protein
MTFYTKDDLDSAPVARGVRAFVTGSGGFRVREGSNDESQTGA